MNTARDTGTKVPEVTLIFWIVKIAATTLGETGGDAVSMSMHLGYLVGSLIFAALFAVVVLAQIRATRFHPFLYWATIIATTTVGTTLADFADRSLGIGYAGGSALLFALLMTSLLVWYRTTGSVSVATVQSPKVEWFYWITILFSQTLGTALGARRLDHRLGRPRLHGWSVGVRGLARAGRSGVAMDAHLPHRAVLDRVHPHAPARRRRRRFPRQAGRCRWPLTEPLFSVDRIARLHRGVHPGFQAETCHGSVLKPPKRKRSWIRARAGYGSRWARPSSPA